MSENTENKDSIPNIKDIKPDLTPFAKPGKVEMHVSGKITANSRDNAVKIVQKK